MITKYRVGFGLIIKVEVERETDKSYWVNGQRRSKSSWDPVYDTPEEAKGAQVAEARKDLELAKRRVDAQRNYLRDAEALKTNP